MVTQDKGWTSVAGGWQCDACSVIMPKYAPHEHDCKDKHGACAALVAGHLAAVKGDWTPGKPIDTQKAEHLRAWKHPVKGGERAVKLAIEAYAAYADDYYDSFERELGTDGYFGEHARSMLRAINASLSMGFKSRLDSGAIHRLLRELAAISGIKGEI